MSNRSSPLDNWYRVVENLFTEEPYPKHNRIFKADNWELRQIRAKVIDMSGDSTFARARVINQWHLVGPNGIEQYHTYESGKAWLEEFVDVVLGVVDRYSVMFRQGIMSENGHVGRTSIHLQFLLTGWLGQFELNVACTADNESGSVFNISVTSVDTGNGHPMWLRRTARDIAAWRNGLSDSVKVGWDSNVNALPSYDLPVTLLVTVSDEYVKAIFPPHGTAGTDFRSQHHSLLRMLTATRESLMYFGYGLVALPDESWKL